MNDLFEYIINKLKTLLIKYNNKIQMFIINFIYKTIKNMIKIFIFQIINPYLLIIIEIIKPYLIIGFIHIYTYLVNKMEIINLVNMLEIIKPFFKLMFSILENIKSFILLLNQFWGSFFEMFNIDYSISFSFSILFLLYLYKFFKPPYLFTYKHKPIYIYSKWRFTCLTNITRYTQTPEETKKRNSIKTQFFQIKDRLNNKYNYLPDLEIKFKDDLTNPDIIRIRSRDFKIDDKIIEFMSKESIVEESRHSMGKTFFLYRKRALEFTISLLNRLESLENYNQKRLDKKQKILLKKNLEFIETRIVEQLKNYYTLKQTLDSKQYELMADTDQEYDSDDIKNPPSLKRKANTMLEGEGYLKKLHTSQTKSALVNIAPIPNNLDDDRTFKFIDETDEIKVNYPGVVYDNTSLSFSENNNIEFVFLEHKNYVRGEDNIGPSTEYSSRKRRKIQQDLLASEQATPPHKK